MIRKNDWDIVINAINEKGIQNLISDQHIDVSFLHVAGSDKCKVSITIDYNTLNPELVLLLKQSLKRNALGNVDYRTGEAKDNKARLFLHADPDCINNENKQKEIKEKIMYSLSMAVRKEVGYIQEVVKKDLEPPFEATTNAKESFISSIMRKITGGRVNNQSLGI